MTLSWCCYDHWTRCHASRAHDYYYNNYYYNYTTTSSSTVCESAERVFRVAVASKWHSLDAVTTTELVIMPVEHTTATTTTTTSSSTVREGGERVFRVAVASKWHSLDAVTTTELVIMPVEGTKRQVISDLGWHVAWRQVDAVNLLWTPASQCQVHLVAGFHLRVDE